eukprot:5595921-Amphidinium_carterae.1
MADCNSSASESNKSRKSFGQGSPLESICCQYPHQAQSILKHLQKDYYIVHAKEIELFWHSSLIVIPSYLLA